LVVSGLILGSMMMPPPALGGGGGGLSTVTVPLVMDGVDSKLAPRAAATLTFDGTQTFRAVSVQLGNAHLPDGTAPNVVFTDNGLISPAGVWVTQFAGRLVVFNGAASGSISTANGDAVPVLGGNGEITLYTADAAGDNVAQYVVGVYTIGNGRP
jgi:hypothetical protein